MLEINAIKWELEVVNLHAGLDGVDGVDQCLRHCSSCSPRKYVSHLHVPKAEIEELLGCSSDMSIVFIAGFQHDTKVLLHDISYYKAFTAYKK